MRICKIKLLVFFPVSHQLLPCFWIYCCLAQEYGWKCKSADEETRKYSDKLRDVYALAERLGCSFGQLAIAWSLKNESVQCLLLGASNIDQLYESLQSLQVNAKRGYIWTQTNIFINHSRVYINGPERVANIYVCIRRAKFSPAKTQRAVFSLVDASGKELLPVNLVGRKIENFKYVKFYIYVYKKYTTEK